MMRLEVLLNSMDLTLSSSFEYKNCDWEEMVYNKRVRGIGRKKSKENEDYEQICLFRSDDDDCPLSCIRGRERWRATVRATHVILYSLILSFSFLFFFSVGRSLSDGWTYVCACMFNKRGDDWRGEERAEYNTTNIRQHRKIDEEGKKQRAREVKVERARAGK
jgi:hypothetical protein